MSIGKKIKVLRAEKGISQEELAVLINKTRALISHIEITSKVNFYTLTELANVFNVPVSYFTEDLNSLNMVKEDRKEYASLPEKLKKLERENELLNEIIQNQKEIIAQLKANLQK